MPEEPASPPDNSGHELDISSEGVNTEVVERFSSTVRFAHQVISSVPQFAGVPSTKVQAVITSDFVATVQRVLDDSGQPGNPYAVERLGGVAVAKAMRTSDDYSAHTVVFDATQWPADSNPVSPFGLVLATHEMSHVMLGRSRWASGAIEGVVFPSVTPVESARSMVRTAVEELRADILAGTALGIAASTTVDGETRPSRPGDLIGHDGYRTQLAAVLDANVYPGWPDIVQRYRTRQIPLDQMWKPSESRPTRSLRCLRIVRLRATSPRDPRPRSMRPWRSTAAWSCTSGRPGIRLWRRSPPRGCYRTLLTPGRLSWSSWMSPRRRSWPCGSVSG